jgi:L-glyceraldehyde 3-phosphate reductase
VTTALIGASRPEQLRENVAALARLDFSAQELAEIDRHAQDGGLDLWARSSRDEAF